LKKRFWETMERIKSAEMAANNSPTTANNAE